MAFHSAHREMGVPGMCGRMSRTANGKHFDEEFRKFFDKVREA
jgi:hypothetical protein